MYIKEVSLKNFRNYQTCLVKLAPCLNIFKGNNAQGKTNFLESIYLSSIGRSPKTKKEKELINWDSKIARVKITLQKKYFKQEIETVLNKETNKAVKINGLSIRKIGDLIGEMPVVYFAPDEIGLIKDGPSDRRRFMDIDISQLNKNYFYLLCKYEKLLDERNKLLKQSKSIESLQETVDLWDSQLADVASKIIFYRLDFIKQIKEPAKQTHSFITNNKENLEISYQGINFESKEKIKDKIYKLYKEKLKTDFDLGFTSIGPHRDDIEIKVNDVDIRIYGSQGQQRLATLSLKIAELSIFEKNIGEKPILLLDDVLSELDTKRCNNLINYIKDYQTIITTTKYFKKISQNDAVFSVKNAQIERIL